MELATDSDDIAKVIFLLHFSCVDAALTAINHGWLLELL